MKLKVYGCAILGIVIALAALYINEKSDLSDAEVLERVNLAIKESEARNERERAHKTAPKPEPVSPTAQIEEEQQREFNRAKQEAVQELQSQDKVTEPSPKQKLTKAAPRSEMEASLLVNLVHIRKGYASSNNTEHRRELEVEAVEISQDYFAAQRKMINKRSEEKRGLASGSLQGFDAKQASALVSINNRERKMRSQMRKFLNGQLDSPL